ncbi:hypothetical protein PMAYCL1PPCAC_18450 [Pristionchus mayeri]|uniref:Uncharacterized protein n=1 Tax=Pristionchus mayeri TaxID=1317129 RepID=A0AAN5I1M6_9BILA|nr:hypothetical protein PMAYCL1PPCAC_18450 [Pristionchus mayeri]
MSFSRARPSESLDSISDDEYARADPKIVRSHIKPNRNYDPYADIRSPRIPHMPHDPSKPAVMKHADLPSVPVSNRPKQGAGSRRSVDSHSRSYSVLSTDSSSSDLYSPSIKMPSRSIPTNQELKEDPEELSRRNESNLFTRKRIIKNENAEEIKKEMGVEVDVRTSVCLFLELHFCFRKITFQCIIEKKNEDHPNVERIESFLGISNGANRSEEGERKRGERRQI